VSPPLLAWVFSFLNSYLTQPTQFPVSDKPFLVHRRQFFETILVIPEDGCGARGRGLKRPIRLAQCNIGISTQSLGALPARWALADERNTESMLQNFTTAHNS
jgi:hypothetical protein